VTISPPWRCAVSPSGTSPLSLTCAEARGPVAGAAGFREDDPSVIVDGLERLLLIHEMKRGPSGISRIWHAPCVRILRLRSAPNPDPHVPQVDPPMTTALITPAASHLALSVAALRKRAALSRALLEEFDSVGGRR
jgi:hypothetical protein